MEKRSRGGVIKKLDKDTYVNTLTGEIGNFDHKNTRKDNKGELRRSFGKLRDIINTNVTIPENCKWLTLTYKENMQDSKRLYNDVDKFIKKLRYKYGAFEYINTIEPQERGAWHSHIILIFDDEAPYIPNNTVEKLWGQGFTKTQALQNIDNVGAYLTAYLTDIETDDENAETKTYTDKNGNTISKKIKKGGRLHLYPTGTKLFRCSRGIKNPIVKTMQYRDFIRQELPDDAVLTYSKTIKVEKENFQNTIIYRTYKLNPTNNENKSKQPFLIDKILNHEIMLVTDQKILECF